MTFYISLDAIYLLNRIAVYAYQSSASTLYSNHARIAHSEELHICTPQFARKPTPNHCSFSQKKFGKGRYFFCLPFVHENGMVFFHKVLALNLNRCQILHAELYCTVHCTAGMYGTILCNREKSLRCWSTIK